MIMRCAVFSLVLLFAPLACNAEIAGVWKHAKTPVWLEILPHKGSAIVVRNDQHPNRVGREVLKTIKADSRQQNLWQALFYIEKLGEYKRVKIALPEADRMLITGKVGFISRSVEWVRADSLPAR